MLWHQRLGHPCSKLLHFALSSFNNNVKISINDDICSQCKYCINAKMHKLPFPNHVMSSTSPLQLVHNNVWGLAPVTLYLAINYMSFLLMTSLDLHGYFFLNISRKCL